jgi:hypothetical protein
VRRRVHLEDVQRLAAEQHIPGSVDEHGLVVVRVMIFARVLKRGGRLLASRKFRMCRPASSTSAWLSSACLEQAEGALDHLHRRPPEVAFRARCP